MLFETEGKLPCAPDQYAVYKNCQRFVLFCELPFNKNFDKSFELQSVKKGKRWETEKAEES